MMNRKEMNAEEMNQVNGGLRVSSWEIVEAPQVKNVSDVSTENIVAIRFI